MPVRDQVRVPVLAQAPDPRERLLRWRVPRRRILQNFDPLPAGLDEEPHLLFEVVPLALRHAAFPEVVLPVLQDEGVHRPDVGALHRGIETT